jgi:hypothetical protein
VRAQADAKLAEVLAPAQDWLNRLAQRLDVEWRVRYGAHVNTPNPHGHVRMSLDAEIEQIMRDPPEWVRVTPSGRYRALEESPHVPATHADISDQASGPLSGAFSTFHDAEPVFLEEGTVLYRVLAPTSVDNSTCWMSKAEFDGLRSKAQWRDRFAVWMNWNVNGEYLTYTVPKETRLPVWRGRAASQQLKDRAGNVIRDSHGNSYWIEGGGEQIVVNPADLRKGSASLRQPTGWGYDEGDVQANLVGVPILQRNWRE